MITEAIKKVLIDLYRGKKEVSAREAKELTPIVNLIKRILPKSKEQEDFEKENEEEVKKDEVKNDDEKEKNEDK